MLLPTRTRRQASSAATFTIRVGSADDFYFDPPLLTAAVGDAIRFTFPPGANHAVVQSRTDVACTPLHGGWASPQFDLRKWGGVAQTFDVNITSPDPVFFYCPLPGLSSNAFHGNTNTKAHCINGMLGAVNAPENVYEEYARSAVGLADLPPQPSLSLVALTGTPKPSSSGKADEHFGSKQIVGLIFAAIALVFIIVAAVLVQRRRVRSAQNRPPPVAARGALRRNSQPLTDEALPVYERARNPDAVPPAPTVRAYEMAVLQPDVNQPPVGHALFGRAPTYTPITEDERTHTRTTSLGVQIDAPPQYEHAGS